MKHLTLSFTDCKFGNLPFGRHNRRLYRIGRKAVYLLAFVLLSVSQTIGQSSQDPLNAVQLSHDFDQHMGRLNFVSDNKDFCDYYLYISFINCEGFEGMSAETAITVSPGQRQVLSYKVRKEAMRYSYQYRYALYRGNVNKKPNIDFVYSLPTPDKEAVTAWITENQYGYQMAFDLSSDTVYACRGGVICDDNLKDYSAKGYQQFSNNRVLSQITVYHSDGSFGEYIFKGKVLIYPGEDIKMGAPIALIERTTERIRFSVYFLDKNKMKEKIGNKHTHFRPFFQTVDEGKVRLENERTYHCELTDEMLMQDMSKREKDNYLKNRQKK